MWVVVKDLEHLLQGFFFIIHLLSTLIFNFLYFSEVKNLPVQYYSQETAWMDQDIFRNWFHSQFVPQTRQHLRYIGLPETALLLIDRSASHPSE